MSEHVVSKGIPGSTLKIIAIITMLIDHIAAVVLADYLSIDGIRTIYKIMRSIGRLGFPIFCFLLVEGFMHTRDIKRYARNLGLFALISEVPFDLAFKHKLIYLDYQNVFFTLFLSLLAIWIISLIEENEQWNKVHQLLSVIAAAVSGLLLVYGFLNHYYALHTTLQIDRVTLEMIRSSYQMLFYIGGVVMALVIYLVLLRIRGREFLIRNSLILSCM
ncbi:MAG: hypothetical protein GX567_03310, partial [Clostridia bacterium]|nr:hypothetical protein [Clostridia bacterium]